MSLTIELKISDNDTRIEAEIEVPPETNQATLFRKGGEFGYEILKDKASIHWEHK